MAFEGDLRMKGRAADLCCGWTCSSVKRHPRQADISRLLFYFAKMEGRFHPGVWYSS